MSIKPNIFKKYDLRGEYPEEVNAQTAFELGRSLAFFWQERNYEPQIVIARDVRFSSPELCENLAAGLLAEQMTVHDLGVLPTDAFYYALASRGQGGVMVTASHNPVGQNGFKIVSPDLAPVFGADLREIVQNSASRLLNEPTAIETVPIKKESTQSDQKKIIEDFTEFIFSFAEALPEGLKIAVDLGNGSALSVWPEFKNKTADKINWLTINDRVDAHLSGRGPNPLLGHEQISALTVKNKADFGVAWDADADRIIFFDEKGKMIRADLVAALILEQCLSLWGPVAVVYDLRASRALNDVIESSYATAIPSPVGHALIKQKMAEAEAFFGVELSGHFYYCFTGTKNTWYAENTWLTLLYLIFALNNRNQPISEAIASLNPYFQSAEINFQTQKQEVIIDRLAKEYVEGVQERLDGLSVQFESWWFNVRPSNTENLLRLTIEANSRDNLKEKLAELEDRIRQYDR